MTCMAASLLVGALACTDLSKLAGTQPLPNGIPDPQVYHTPEGAMALYQATITAFQSATAGKTSIGGVNNIPAGQDEGGTFVQYVFDAGLFTDELESGSLGGAPADYTSDGILPQSQEYIDTRIPRNLDGTLSLLYLNLNAIRGGASLGVGALATYDPSASPALRGHLYALAGYSEILLADLYCSGIPLSTVDFNGDYTYHAGSTTAQVYQDAIAKLDSAVALSSDSTRILNLARVAKGRAWLDLGQFGSVDGYDSAAAAVASVPDGFSYQFLVDWSSGPVNSGPVFSYNNGITVSDREGENGLPFLSSGDPRSASDVTGTNAFGVPQYVPNKYGGASPGKFPITVADWIEVRLIRAEAALQHGDVSGWLTQLNFLRANAITPALPPLTDPGTATARVDLLFQERAYWLFMTGHRQGDLRRLIRQYHRIPDQVYPTGPYDFGGMIPSYGNAVSVPVPSSESTNPLFTGCISNGA